MDNLQRQYLEAMGIQMWESRDGSAPTSPPEVVAEPAISEPVVRVAPVQAGKTEPLHLDTSSETQPKSAPGQAPELVPEQRLAQEDDVALLDWNALQSRVSTCALCDELVANRSQTVFGVGDPAADWMVIGEAPGTEEDQQGEPFVGPAGQLLNNMLLAMGLKREQTFLANILKCRLPDKRDPKQQEAANCRTFLERQIALVKPKIILLLGKVAAQNILSSDQTIGHMRGEVYYYGDEKIPIIVTYHPAYLLRAPKEKRKAWDDLKLAMSVYSRQAGA
ncbi:MAG: uracil-DNA glycosylase [Gammaproteobacteria bacterium]|nr:uracil-DNA glycosylase [Gammaproteobacteria bacterium]